MKLIAQVVPYSSVVGGGVMLQDETGRVVAQLSLRGFTPNPAQSVPLSPDEAQAHKAAYVAMCERIARAINAGQAERQVRHFKNPGIVYDVVAARALFMVSDRSNWDEGYYRLIRDGDLVTVYRNEGKTFVRFPDEMVAPRFT